MPNIVTAAELRAVLGVSSSLYSDEYLNSIIDSAEQVILPLLTQYSSAVSAVNVKDGVITFTTIRPNYFVPNQEVDVTGCGLYSDTYTVTGTMIKPFLFTADTTEADTDFEIPQIPAGAATLSGSSAAELYANVDAVNKAILVVSVEIFQSITAPGNQIMSDNFTPAPFVLGRSLQSRVIGLLSNFIDVETMAQ